MTANAPISEQFRLASKEWVKLNAAAQMLEETKTAFLSQLKKKLGDIPDSHAEREVKSGAEWMDFITRMVEAREAANLAKAKMEYTRMRFNEWQSAEASKRAEMRM